jgi:hypothetical protein
LENENIKKYFTEDKINYNGWWVYGVVDYNKISYLNDLKMMKEELEKAINEEL